MTVNPSAAKHSHAHEGTTYHFCCVHCLEKFKADPQRYLSAASAKPAQLVSLGVPAARPSAPAKSIQSAPEKYVCPMCPEVEEDKPGACPSCGMAFQHELPGGWRPWLELLLATPVVLWGGWLFFQRGWASIVNRSTNMFTLIAMGTGVAYLYSLVTTITPGIFPASFREIGGTPPVYFEAAAAITTLVLLGQVLELRARSRTGAAIRALLDLSPKMARVLRNGREE